MKSLQSHIVWRVLLYTTILIIPIFLIITYIVQRKAEEAIVSNITFIRDTKYLSLNKDNLQTALDLTNTNYAIYLLNNKGEMYLTTSYAPDEETKIFCRDTVTEGTKKLDTNKYIAVKKNGDLCLVVEGNTNNTILLGKYILKILSSFGMLLLILIGFILYIVSKKVSKPIKQVADNLGNSLIGKWELLQKPESNLLEISELIKNSNFTIETIRKHSSGPSIYSQKVAEVKDLEGQFLNLKNASDANKFRLAVDSAVDVMIIVDKFGYINYANKSLTTLTGITLDQAENKKITDLWHREDDPNIWKTNYEKVIKDKKPVTFSSIGTKKNNLRFESQIQITPISTDGIAIDNFLVIDRDVTEEKQKERIKNEFISVVSHELRTPMTVIRGYSTLLAEGKLGELNEKQKEYINKINMDTGQLLELANDMLDLQKFESGKIELKFEPTSIFKFVEPIVNNFIPEYTKKGLKLTLQNNLTHEMVNIDLKYFARVITNLMTNAYKYTEKGEVTVFLVNPDEHHVVVAVKDTGVGIKEEAIGHLFERFYQAQGVMQRKQEGTGLGLSIVKRVAEAHNGMVWVESKEGVGSTFYVALPSAE